MKAKQLVKAGKIRFEGWLEPRFYAHRTALKRAEKTNPVWRLIKLHWTFVGEFEADIVLAFSAGLRYLFIVVVLLCFWNSMKQ
ncbi:MAG: hypothetical protein ACFBSF_06180 [Leptolyngbyaceae cyanobacterium]